MKRIMPELTFQIIMIQLIFRYTVQGQMAIVKTKINVKNIHFTQLLMLRYGICTSRVGRLENYH